MIIGLLKWGASRTKVSYSPPSPVKCIPCVVQAFLQAEQFVLTCFDSVMGKAHCLSLNPCPTRVGKVEHEGFNPPRQNAHKSFHVPALMFGNPSGVGAILATAEKNCYFQGIPLSNRPLFSNCFSYSLR